MRELIKQLSNRDLEVLNIIHKNESMTKKTLLDITGMTLTTLNRTMKKLEDLKFIVEKGNAKSTGGRKAVEYSVANKGIYLIGIDLSRTYTKIILTNLKMDILKKEEFAMTKNLSPEMTVEKIVTIINGFLNQCKISTEKVLGIGIGTVGPLDIDSGTMLNPLHFFHEHWKNVPIKEWIEQKTSLPCFIDNGANTAILAEYLLGKGKDFRNLVYIHCGIGIRSSVITNGIIIRTMNDTEDAFGQMIIDLKKETNTTNGCIESFASIEGIVRTYNESGKNHFPAINIMEGNYKELLTLAQSGQLLANESIKKGTDALGIGLVNLVRLLNPQLVILCGPLIQYYDSYYDLCIESFHQSYGNNALVTFSKGGLFEEDAIAIGSCLMVMEAYLKRR